MDFSSIFEPLGPPKICVAPTRELNFHFFDHLFSRSLFDPQNDPKMHPKSLQNHLKIYDFCFIFGSWAAPGASQSDFGRSQSAQGALGELFEIIKSLQNPYFDALGRSWGPLGALLDPQEHPKRPKSFQNEPKYSQNSPK